MWPLSPLHEKCDFRAARGSLPTSDANGEIQPFEMSGRRRGEEILVRDERYSRGKEARAGRESAAEKKTSRLVTSWAAPGLSAKGERQGRVCAVVARVSDFLVWIRL